jgi:hypothetical protein
MKQRQERDNVCHNTSSDLDPVKIFFNKSVLTTPDVCAACDSSPSFTTLCLYTLFTEGSQPLDWEEVEIED